LNKFSLSGQNASSSRSSRSAGGQSHRPSLSSMVKVINLQSSEEQVDETNPVFSEEVKPAKLKQ
jgi:hypothetical protein